MTLDWFHAVLGMFFVMIWLIVGQILARERKQLEGQRMTE